MMYGSINPNKSILTQKSSITGLNTTQFYAKNPDAINVDSNFQDLKKKYEAMKHQLSVYRQNDKEFQELKGENHQLKKVRVIGFGEES